MPRRAALLPLPPLDNRHLVALCESRSVVEPRFRRRGVAQGESFLEAFSRSRANRRRTVPSVASLENCISSRANLPTDSGGPNRQAGRRRDTGHWLGPAFSSPIKG